jgi:hypothetical protein
MFEGSGKYLSEPVFIVFRHMGHADVVKIDLVLLVKRAALHAQFQQVLCLILLEQFQVRPDLRLAVKSRTPC